MARPPSPTMPAPQPGCSALALPDLPSGSVPPVFSPKMLERNQLSLFLSKPCPTQPTAQPTADGEAPLQTGGRPGCGQGARGAGGLVNVSFDVGLLVLKLRRFPANQAELVTLHGVDTRQHQSAGQMQGWAFSLKRAKPCSPPPPCELGQGPRGPKERKSWSSSSFRACGAMSDTGHSTDVPKEEGEGSWVLHS